MPDPEDFTVSVAQRRLLEAIAAYNADLGPVDQQRTHLVLACGLEHSARTALAMGDQGACEIFAALGELVANVAREQLQEVI